MTKSVANKANRHPSFFAVIKAIITRFDCRVPLKIDGISKINFMSDKISEPFLFIPLVLHCLNLDNNNLIVN